MLGRRRAAPRPVDSGPLCSRRGPARWWRPCGGPQSLPKKTAAIWTDLENLCSPQINYRAYRAIEAEAKPPFIPFIGMHLRDMVFMNDGNPSELPNGLIKYAPLARLLVG